MRQRGARVLQFPNEKNVTFVGIMPQLNSGKWCVFRLAERYIMLVFTVLFPWTNDVLFSG